MRMTSLVIGKIEQKLEQDFIARRAPIRTIPKHLEEKMVLRRQWNHVFLEIGEGQPLIFSHGLMGGIFNIENIALKLSKQYRLLMPFLPMYDLPLDKSSTPYLGDYLISFIRDLNLKDVTVIGSSMGGGTALFAALNPLHNIKRLVLCGSSGLSTIPLSKGFFRRKNFEFVKGATKDIFVDKTVPSEEMVQDVYNAIQNYDTVLRVIRMTKSAKAHRVHDFLHRIEVPTLLVWGREDPITKVDVAPQFEQMMPNAQLHILDKCGHVPTQEKPKEFLNLFNSFMKTAI